MSTGGMNIPEPGAPMRKMSFEFHDPAQQAAAAQQAAQPQGGMPVQPNGPLPPGAQPAPDQQPSPGPVGNVFGSMAGGADQFGQGPNSSMFTDDQLAAMLNEQPISPVDLQAAELEQQLGGDQVDPQLQMRMMEAARRMGGF